MGIDMLVYVWLLAYKNVSPISGKIATTSALIMASATLNGFCLSVWS